VGIVEADAGGRILNFVEKPPRGSPSGNLSNGGIYILEKKPWIISPPNASVTSDMMFSLNSWRFACRFMAMSCTLMIILLISAQWINIRKPTGM